MVSFIETGSCMKRNNFYFQSEFSRKMETKRNMKSNERLKPAGHARESQGTTLQYHSEYQNLQN